MIGIDEDEIVTVVHHVVVGGVRAVAIATLKPTLNTAMMLINGSFHLGGKSW